MSSFYLVEGKILSFSEYCLSESIIDTPTKFGTNMTADNNETRSIGNHHFAFFHNQHNNDTSHHMVYVNSETGEVGLGSSDHPSVSINDYSDTRKGSRHSGISTFGKSMHVLRHLADKHNIKHIRFTGADERLSVLYKHMVKNKPFLDSMSNHGWKYDGEKDGDHHFSRD